MQGYPLLPVYAGEMSARMLGVDADAFGPDGKPVVGELGELVIKQPMPSMPVAFWDDPDGSRYHEAYFEFFPGVWRFGDWIMFTERGSAVITGRSDATLNRGGVRLGTSEIYSVVEEIDEVLDSLVVHLEEQDELLLFVVLRPGIELDDELRKRIAGALRNVAVAAARAGHDRRRARDPAHAHGEEARGPGQAHPHRGRRSRRSRRATRSSSPARSSRSPTMRGRGRPASASRGRERCPAEDQVEASAPDTSGPYRRAARQLPGA